MLSKPLRSRNLAIFMLVLPLLALSGGAEGKKRPPPTPWTGPVPQADCGPNDRVETGLQGQTTLAERNSGASMQAYNCNMELVGQFTGEGAGWQHAWFDQCAYYGTRNTPAQVHPGTVVVDVSDPQHPTATAHLADPALLEPWESLKVNQKRKLLGGVQLNGPGFAIYDLSADCRNPVLKASVVLPGATGHAGDFAPDGLTYYGTSSPGAAGGRHFYAIDVTDPANPTPILRYPPPPGGIGAPHDLSISEDGTRAYIANRFLGNAGEGHNGLVILDVSDIQFRRPNPQVREISTLFWEDGSTAQMPTQVRIKGRPYILFTDELGSGGTNRAAACAQNLPPDGFARLIDISDETNPKVTAKLMLEVHDPANCAETLTDSTNPIFRYDTHYCTVDDPKNAKLAACSYFQSGIRVFDIRDPYRPKEVAYYKPGAVGAAARPGSYLAQFVPNRDHDWASSNSRFVKIKGVNYLWITSQDNGFQVLKFTNHLKHLAPGLFSDDDDDDDDDRGRDRDDD